MGEEVLEVRTMSKVLYFFIFECKCKKRIDCTKNCGAIIVIKSAAPLQLGTVFEIQVCGGKLTGHKPL